MQNIYLELMSDYQLKTSSQYEKEMKKFRLCTAVESSICGNFLFIGFDDGVLVKLSTQRGIFNSSFKFTRKERGAIKRLFTDAVNNCLLLWQEQSVIKVDFFSGKVLRELKFQDIQNVYFC